MQMEFTRRVITYLSMGSHLKKEPNENDDIHRLPTSQQSLKILILHLDK